MTSVYFDYNATAPVHPSVIEVVAEAMRQSVNVSAPYQLSQKARQRTQAARRDIAEALEADANHLIFTSGGTESNNTVLKAIKWDRIIISATEHPSVIQSAPHAERVAIGANGQIDLADLERLLASRSRETQTLVSIQWANSETGVIQPIEEIVSLCRRYGAFCHSDGVQALGKIPVSFQQSDLDYLSLSAHKIGGPQGVGLLIIKPGVPFAPFLTGGPQQRERRAGTTDFPSLLGCAEAIRLIDLEHFSSLRSLHKDLEDHLKKTWPSTQIIGDEALRLPNTTLVLIPEIPNTTSIMKLDLAGISVGGGLACSSGSIKASDTLKAMGFTDKEAGSVIRISSGWKTKIEDFTVFMAAFIQEIVPLSFSKAHLSESVCS